MNDPANKDRERTVSAEVAKLIVAGDHLAEMIATTTAGTLETDLAALACWIRAKSDVEQLAANHALCFEEDE